MGDAGIHDSKLWKRNTGFRQTSLLLSRLIRLTIEAGTVTAIIATVDLIFVITQQTLFTMPALVLAKLYSNNMLVIFNSRITIVGGRGDAGEAISAIELNHRNVLSGDRNTNGSSGRGRPPWTRRLELRKDLHRNRRHTEHASSNPHPINRIDVHITMHQEVDQTDGDSEHAHNHKYEVK